MTTGNKPTTSISRKIIYILACVIVLLLIAAVFMPKNIKTSFEGEIDAPKTYVFNLINNQKSVKSWNAWLEDDPETIIEFDRISMGKGSGYSWKSKASGDGSIKYTDVIPNEKISAELSMGDDKSYYSQSLTEKDGKTTIKWDFNSRLPFPKNVFGPVMKYTINKYNKKSLEKMKTEIKKRQEGNYHNYKVGEVVLNKKHYVTSRNTVSFEEINNFFSKNVSAILLKLQQEGISATGPACALYYNYDEAKGMADLAVAVPVLQPVSIKDLGSESLPDGNVAVVDYYGDYSKSEHAHYALDEYIKDRSYKLRIPVVEEYITDPLKEKDQSKWLTKIYYYAGH